MLSKVISPLNIAALSKRCISLTSCRSDRKTDQVRPALNEYEKKRNFHKTNEPRPTIGEEIPTNERRFVVQEHHASILHFDFRLEHNGVLKSWSIPKGPSLNPRDKRLAILVEDHPVPYLNFEGRIPEGEYGAGEVRIWDRGNYELVDNRDMNVAMEEGKLSFFLHGKQLVGGFRMIRLRSRSTERNNQWLLMKKKDSFANAEFVLQRILDYGSRTKRADV